MTIKLFVGKLSYDTQEKTLTDLFSQYGEVKSVAIIMDRMTNQSKGFAFVEMADIKAGKAAIAALNDTEVDGRAIHVSAAKEREDKPRRDFGHRRSW